MNLISNQMRQDSDCSTPVAIMAAEVRGKTLVERRGDVAIYSGPIADAYEVIRIRVAEAGLLGDKWMPRREIYPPSEAWGVNAWSFSPASHPDGPLNAARRKMKMLLRPARTKATIRIQIVLATTR